VEPAGRLACDGLLACHEALDGPRIVADQVLRHAPDHGGEARAAITFVVFRPAYKAFVGRDLEERKVAPARIAVKILDLDDFHGCFLSGGRQHSRLPYAAKRLWRACPPKLRRSEGGTMPLHGKGMLVVFCEVKP